MMRRLSIEKCKYVFTFRWNVCIYQKPTKHKSKAIKIVLNLHKVSFECWHFVTRMTRCSHLISQRYGTIQFPQHIAFNLLQETGSVQWQVALWVREITSDSSNLDLIKKAMYLVCWLCFTIAWTKDIINPHISHFNFLHMHSVPS